MAGQKKIRTAKAVLDSYPPETIYEWIANGDSIERLADRLGIAKTGVWGWIQRPEHIDHVARARKIRASKLVDESLEIADTALPEDVPKAKLRTDIRRFIASKLDRDTWGDDRGPQVAIQINGLHVDSLRVRNLDEERD